MIKELLSNPINITNPTWGDFICLVSVVCLVYGFILQNMYKQTTKQPDGCGELISDLFMKAIFFFVLVMFVIWLNSR